jgi:hypothetical protein
MLQLILDGGVWSVLVCLLGLGALGCSSLSFRSGSKLLSLGVGLAAAAFLLGIAGTAMGLYQAGIALDGLPEPERAALMARAVGIAMSPLILGSVMAGFSAILCGVARGRGEAVS